MYALVYFWHTICLKLTITMCVQLHLVVNTFYSLANMIILIMGFVILFDSCANCSAHTILGDPYSTVLTYRVTRILHVGAGMGHLERRNCLSCPSFFYYKFMVILLIAVASMELIQNYHWRQVACFWSVWKLSSVSIK